MVNFAEFLKIWSLRSNSVTRQVTFKRTKIGGNAKIQKILMRHWTRKNSWKFVYIQARYCRSSFNLTNFLTKKIFYKIHKIENSNFYLRQISVKLCLHLSYIEQNSFHFDEIFHIRFKIPILQKSRKNSWNFVYI